MRGWPLIVRSGNPTDSKEIVFSPNCRECHRIAATVRHMLRVRWLKLANDGVPLGRHEVVKTVSPCYVVRGDGWWIPVCEARFVRRGR